MSDSRRFAVVVSRWNELVTDSLLRGAVDTLTGHGEIEVWRVPGAWEIPLAVGAVLDRTPKPVAVIALGCILQGQTPHAQMLAGDVGSALMKIQIDHRTPIAWGILTPDTAEQALDRAGLKMGNKGREAAEAALEMVEILESIRSS